MRWVGLMFATVPLLHACVASGPVVSTEDFASVPYSDEPAIWRAKCNMCHGHDGRAQTRMGRIVYMPDFTDARWQAEATDACILEAITRGVEGRRMAAYADKLESGELDEVLRFIRAFPQRPSTQATAAGRKPLRRHVPLTGACWCAEGVPCEDDDSDDPSPEQQPQDRLP